MSKRGNKYCFIFTNDFNRKAWMYFLKEKAETLEKFKDFKAREEKQSRYHIKVLRSDRGGEYTFKAYEDFFKEHGIIHQLAAI